MAGASGRQAGSTPRRHARPVAAGGWRRAVLGLGVGVLAGALVSWSLTRGGR